MLKLRRYFDTTGGCDLLFSQTSKHDGTGVPAWETGNTRKLRLSTNVECRTYGVEMLNSDCMTPLQQRNRKTESSSCSSVPVRSQRYFS